MKEKYNSIYCGDSLEHLKTFDDFTFDINYSDPPYQLGSEVIIREDGKVDYKKSVDFMNKWGGLSGAYWEQWFKEAYRTLKHGGYLIMFGMDRQLLLFKYYANLAGFTEQQSLYWYFISNFPKATDLSKQIDKNAGAKETEYRGFNYKGGTIEKRDLNRRTDYGYISPPAETELAKKYEGYKYSISPLKQTNETILVFKKPYKTGSCLHDTLAYENGDETCGCFALDIDGNRVGTNGENPKGSGKPSNNFDKAQIMPGRNGGNGGNITPDEGRYPSQTFCDSNTAEVLDKQSGVSKSSVRIVKDEEVLTKGIPFETSGYKNRTGGGVNDTGGCSKILHKCDFEENEHDLYFYNPKVSKSERNAGCDEFEEKPHNNRKENGKSIVEVSNKMMKNNHPTLKPIKLNERILKLFKTPNEQKIIFPFAGSGSEVIGGIKAGFTNWVGCEINPEYVEIAKARIKHWTTQEEQISFLGDENEITLLDETNEA